MKRRRKDGDKAEDADRVEANVRWELGGRGDWCASVRVGAPRWRSHTSRWGRAGWCTYMAKPSRWSRCTYMGKPLSRVGEQLLLYALVCGMTNQQKRGGWQGGGWQVHLYGEAARCVP